VEEDDDFIATIINEHSGEREGRGMCILKLVVDTPNHHYTTSAHLAGHPLQDESGLCQ
jgi:hypothetical protein